MKEIIDFGQQPVLSSQEPWPCREDAIKKPVVDSDTGIGRGG